MATDITYDYDMVSALQSAEILGYSVDGGIHYVLARQGGFLRSYKFVVKGPDREPIHEVHDYVEAEEIILSADTLFSKD